jgi:hypothetical protein
METHKRAFPNIFDLVNVAIGSGTRGYYSIVYSSRKKPFLAGHIILAAITLFTV